jgi:hypothetical protein
LSIDIGLISSRELVRKFSMPFFVDASLALLYFEPLELGEAPSVIKENSGPRAFVMAVFKGDITSFACGIVGAVVI